MRRPSIFQKPIALRTSDFFLILFGTVLISAGLVMGVLAVPRSSLITGLVIVFAGNILLLCGFCLFGWYYLRTLVSRLAPFILNPYGVRDADHSRKLLNDFLFAKSKASISIVDGKVSEKSDPSLFKETWVGPGTMQVDWESAVLVERVVDKSRKFELAHAGEHQLGEKDRILGVVDLRPQRESFDLQNVSTGDGILLRIKGSIMYLVEQDLEHLKRARSHYTTLSAVKRAVMPVDEWQKKTKGAIEPILRHTLREYALGELFIREPKFTPMDMRAVLEGLAVRRVTPFALQDLEARVWNGLRAVASQWGVQITLVRIEEIFPPEELTESAMRAYQVWLSREAELQKVETAARIAQREAEAAREMAEIQRDTEMIRSEANAASLRTSAIVEKETTLIRAEMQAESKRITAEAEQRAQMMLAQAESDAHRLRMNAIGDAGMDVARRIDLLMDVTGRKLDDAVLREFMRAIGLLKSEAEHLDNQTSHVIRIREIASDRNTNRSEDK